MSAEDHEVVVLFGGASAERSVSIDSAREVARAVRECARRTRLWWWSPRGGVCEMSDFGLAAAAPGRDDQPFDPAQCVRWWPTLQRALGSLCEPRAPSVVFNALHGGRGENGDVSHLLEHRGLLFTASGSAACRVAFDKAAGRSLAASNGVATARGLLTSADCSADRAAIQALLDFAGTVIVKPRHEGSSIGVGVARSLDEVSALTRGQAGWVVEAFIAGREFTVGVVDLDDGRGARALPVVEILKSTPIFDFDAKYGGGTEEVCPARLPAPLTHALQQAALRMHGALAASGYSRSDFIVHEGRPFLLETNALPGLTATSLLPRALRAEGVEFRDFVAAQLRLAVARGQTAA